MKHKNVQNGVIALSTREQDILALSYHCALAPYSEIAKQGNFHTHTVRRLLQKLLEQGVVKAKAFIDIYRLGLTQFELSYAIASSSAKSAETFLRMLQKSPQVSWIGSYSGEYQYIVTVCCRSAQELLHFVERTTANPEILVTGQHIAARLRYTEFPLQCLSEKVRQDKPFVFGVEGHEKIDSVDHLLLSLLSDNALISTRDLAQKLNLSQSAAIQRMRSLERRGVIPGYSYVVDFSRLGLQAFCIIISTNKHTSELTNRILAFAKKSKSISYVSESLGAYDYKFGVLLREPSQIISLAQEISEAFVKDIIQLSTLTAFDYQKVSRYPFKDIDAIKSSAI